MLPHLKTSSIELASAREALDHLAHRVVQRVSVPLRDLRLDPDGNLSHQGPLPIEQLQRVPVSDVAVAHLNTLVGIPSGYAARIDPNLHSSSFNRLAAERLATVTVLVERDTDDASCPRAIAVLRGSAHGVDDELVLRHLDKLGLPVIVQLDVGGMSVQVGDLGEVEVGAGDALRACASLRNLHWSGAQPTPRPALNVSVFALRLVCSNGAFIQRGIADARVTTWGRQSDVASHLERELDRVLSFPLSTFKRAAEAMREDMPSDEQHRQVASFIARHASPERARDLLCTATSWWDHVNAVTAAANLARTAARRVALQIEGGRMFDEFIGRVQNGSLAPDRAQQRLRRMM
jgi:hypothetical protein